MSFKQELESARTPDRPVADSALFAGAQSIIREQEATIAELRAEVARLRKLAQGGAYDWQGSHDYLR
jgi:hypothetical protein